MDLRANTKQTVTVGPVVNIQGKAFGRKKLWPKEVLTSANGPLQPVPDNTEIRVDVDGIYNVLLDISDAGPLVTVVTVDGQVTKRNDHCVLSQRAYDEKYGEDQINTIATNVPIINGHIITDPDLLVGVDLARTVNRGAEINLPCVTVGEVTKVIDSPVTDIQPAVDAVVDCKATAQGENKVLGACLASIVEKLGDFDKLKLEILAVITALKAVSDQVNNVALKPEDIGATIKKSLAGLTKSTEITSLSETLLSLQSAVDAIKVPTVDDLKNTIDGEVKVAGLDLKDGKVHVSQVDDKAGYSLGKDGLDRIKSDIMNHITEQMKRIEAKIKNNTVLRSHR